MPPELLGPFALTAGALIAVAALWLDHKRNDADVRAQRDTAIAGWKEQQAATNAQATATATTAASVAKLVEVVEAIAPPPARGGRG